MLQALEGGSATQLVAGPCPMPPGRIARGGTIILNRFGERGVGDPQNHWGSALTASERYVAYVSDESGRVEIYGRPFRGAGAKRQVTTDGGREVTWSRDGREPFFRHGDRMLAMPIATAPLGIGPARVLFDDRFVQGPAGLPAYDVAPDGRFLMLKAVVDQPPSALRVVRHWFDELNRLVP